MDARRKLLASVLPLAGTPTAMTFELGRRLREVVRGRVVLECAACGFDYEGYAAAGHARLRPLAEAGHSQLVTRWEGSRTDGDGLPRDSGDDRLSQTVGSAWLEVGWEEHTLELVQITWAKGMGVSRACFLVAMAEEAARRFYQEVCRWSAIPHGEVLVFERGEWKKDRALFEAVQRATLESLVLPPGLKEAVVGDVLGFFRRREVYERHGVPWKRGVLLVGPPGNGKTLAAKVLCRAAGVPVLYVRSLESAGFLSSGEHAHIRDVFELARRTVPCLLVLEDLDALVKPSNRSQLLNELDGFADNSGLCVLATSNYPERLDPSILDRPSRFDRKYEFGLPAEAERAAYLRVWNGSQERSLRLTEQGILGGASVTEGFSYAYLKELCLSATMAWINSSPGTSMDDLLQEHAAKLRAQMRGPGEDAEAGRAGAPTDAGAGESAAEDSPEDTLRKLMAGF